MINDTQWCWNDILKKGETLLISSHSNIEEEHNLSMITGQIALALASGHEALLSNNLYKVKILYINTYMNKKEIFDFYIKQIGGENKINLYNDNFIMLPVDSEEFFMKKEELKKIIIDMDPDLIIYDNITRLISPTYEFNDILKDIKEISGLKSKIISNFFHPILQHNEVSSLKQECSAEINLKNISLFDGYSISLNSKYNNYSVQGLVKKNENREFFYYENLFKYKGSNKNKIIVKQINQITNPLP